MHFHACKYLSAAQIVSWAASEKVVYRSFHPRLLDNDKINYGECKRNFPCFYFLCLISLLHISLHRAMSQLNPRTPSASFWHIHPQNSRFCRKKVLLVKCSHCSVTSMILSNHLSTPEAFLNIVDQQVSPGEVGSHPE